MTKRALMALLFVPLISFADPAFVITLENPSGIVALGQKITWHVTVADDPNHTVTAGTYRLKKGGAKEIGKGDLTFGTDPVTIETTLNEPGTILLQITAPVGGKPLQGLAGVAIAPGKLQPSAPAPADFDAFWKAKIDELNAVPANPVLEKVDCKVPGIDYWKITMDNVRGTHIRGQLARPATGDKFPAIIVLQSAGVYQLKTTNVTPLAKDGWLVLNLNAHDLPIDETPEFYDEKLKNELKDYPAIGNDDRETSYFLRMFLACHRGVEYLSQRPDWNGKVLVATGISQGGLQSFVAGALNPKVTCVMVGAPAGCDNTGGLAERGPGWPYWKAGAKGKDPKKVMDAACYFDGVNFAARVHCPTLVGLGLIDLVAPPSGVFTAFNQLKGPKEAVVMPTSPHRIQRPYYERAAAWRAALLKGEPPPVVADPALAE